MQEQQLTPCKGRVVVGLNSQSVVLVLLPANATAGGIICRLFFFRIQL
jgi:hypothetical protein